MPGHHCPRSGTQEVRLPSRTAVARRAAQTRIHTPQPRQQPQRRSRPQGTRGHSPTSGSTRHDTHRRSTDSRTSSNTRHHHSREKGVPATYAANAARTLRAPSAEMERKPGARQRHHTTRGRPATAQSRRRHHRHAPLGMGAPHTTHRPTAQTGIRTHRCRS